LFVEEALTLCLMGWLLAGGAAEVLVHMAVRSAAPLAIFAKIKAMSLAVSLALAIAVGVLGSIIPSHRAARTNIVEGLRHIG
jgi:ABC-type antimicrobial peptide transport system permease subunit